MRKIIAVLLALAQLVFGVWLISRGGNADVDRNRHISEMRAYGTQYLFELSSFSYRADDDAQPISFHLKGTSSEPGYYPIETDDRGHSVLGARTDTVPDGPYLDTNREFLYDMDAAAAHAVFSGADKSLYLPALFSKSKFSVNGESKYVYAAASVLDGELVFTAIVIGGTYY